jgi:hypothetical protein
VPCWPPKPSARGGGLEFFDGEFDEHPNRDGFLLACTQEGTYALRFELTALTHFSLATAERLAQEHLDESASRRNAELLPNTVVAIARHVAGQRHFLALVAARRR